MRWRTTKPIKFSTVTALQRQRIGSGRNEVIETPGRLHPLWPQNKRLRTPWTTDWMHTGQDRWIQTELAFTLAKNATKPNPFETISLLTTRKENNWKTEETLAVVTLETEWIEEYNPWCLWWWWCWLSKHFQKIKIKTYLKVYFVIGDPWFETRSRICSVAR